MKKTNIPTGPVEARHERGVQGRRDGESRRGSRGDHRQIAGNAARLTEDVMAEIVERTDGVPL
jgi:hypothetical protein